MQNTLNTATDLRSALKPWIALAFIAAAIAGALGALLKEGWYTDILLALASAALSVAVALLITEYALKPLYVRDILSVARLSAQVHDSGLETLQRLTKTDFTMIFAPGGDIDVTGDIDLIKHVWPAMIEVASTTPLHAHVHVNRDTPPTSWLSLEKAWRASECESQGSKLTLTTAGAKDTQLAVGTSSHSIVAVSDGASHGNPLLLTFRRGRSRAFNTTLAETLERLRRTDETPVYQTPRLIEGGKR